MKKLPPHIEQVSEKWYKNLKKEGKGQFIHADKIDDWLERYWSFRPTQIKIGNATMRNKNNISAAKKRWGI
jgi:hypothetical protein